MQINLQDLAAKRVKSAEGLTISDHTLDLAKFTGSELIFTGTGSRGLVIKNARQVEVNFKDCVIDNAGTGVTVKFDGFNKNISVRGNNAKLFGKAGNSASQMIYFVGTYADISLAGFEIDQRRDIKSGSTVTGACVQFAGVYESNIASLGIIDISELTISNAGDEDIYFNHFEPKKDGKLVAMAEILRIRNVNMYRAGRDFIQWQGARKVFVSGCYGENGGLEGDSNHCSALSINGRTESFDIEDCNFNNVAQLAYVGTYGMPVTGTFDNVSYTQGVHAGSRSNQACYLKSPGEFTFKKCNIQAPNVKRSIVCADGAVVNYDLTDDFIGSRMDYAFNGGKFIEKPVISTIPSEVIEERTSAGVKYFLNWNGKRIEL